MSYSSTEDRIGPVVLERTPWQVAEPILAPALGHYPDPAPEEACGDPQLPRTDTIEGSKGLTLMLKERGPDLVIEGVVVPSKAIPTDLGIRVGDDVRSLRAAYPGVVFVIEEIARTGSTAGPYDVLGAFTTTPDVWWEGLRGVVDDAGFMNNPPRLPLCLGTCASGWQYVGPRLLTGHESNSLESL